MDPMGRRQHLPSWAWDWCFCCRSSSWPVPSWLLILHRVQWLIPQVKVHSLALSKAWFSILAFSCAKLSLGLRIDALVHWFLRAYWNGASAFGLKKFWRSARSTFRYIIVITMFQLWLVLWDPMSFGNLAALLQIFRSNKSANVAGLQQCEWEAGCSSHLIFWAIFVQLASPNYNYWCYKVKKHILTKWGTGSRQKVKMRVGRISQ